MPPAGACRQCHGGANGAAIATIAAAVVFVFASLQTRSMMTWRAPNGLLHRCPPKINGMSSQLFEGQQQHVWSEHTSNHAMMPFAPLDRRQWRKFDGIGMWCKMTPVGRQWQLLQVSAQSRTQVDEDLLHYRKN